MAHDGSAHLTTLGAIPETTVIDVGDETRLPTDGPVTYRQRLVTVDGNTFLNLEDKPSRIKDVVFHSLLTGPGSCSTVAT